MKSEHQQRVEEFMRLAGQDVPSEPTMPSAEVRQLRAKLILEEAEELINALGYSIYLTDDTADLALTPDRQPDLIEIIDGVADLSVVSIGTLSACGIHDTPFIEAVDRNNLEKFGEGGRRDPNTGKWLKPPGHKPPDIAGILAKLKPAVVKEAV